MQNSEAIVLIKKQRQLEQEVSTLKFKKIQALQSLKLAKEESKDIFRRTFTKLQPEPSISLSHALSKTKIQSNILSYLNPQ